MLNGFAGVGKSTISKKYIDTHPLTLSIEGDAIIVMLGQWLEHEDEARELMFALTKSMTTTYLASGHDVLLPYLLTNAEHAQAFEDIAKAASARFFEVVLLNDREEAIDRLLERGIWGEVGIPPLTEADRPEIEDLYSRMITSLDERPNTIKINSIRGSIDATYQQFLDVTK